MSTFDVIIVGAGAAGLMAARELIRAGRSVCILEARDRIGGRIHTINDTAYNYPVERGAEFIHGKLATTFALMKEAGLDHYRIKGNVYQVKKNSWRKENDFIERIKELESALNKVRQDLPLQQFLTKYFPGNHNRSFRSSVTRYAEGYDAADTSLFSTLAFKDELQKQDENNYRLTKGYGALIDYLYNDCINNGVAIHLNSIVTAINWQQANISIHTADQTIYHAKQVVITVPLGVWQARQGSKGAIRYMPAIKEKQQAAKQLGFGGVIKIVLQFDAVFWKEKAAKISFILSDATIPTWWTQEPDKHAMFSGWIAGPAAVKLKRLSNDAVLQKAIASLAALFNMKPALIRQQLLASHVCNWLTDPFARGAYSYPVVDAARHHKTLADPLDNKLFFAGEALYQGNEIGTVEAALNSGKDVAYKLLARDFPTQTPNLKPQTSNPKP